MTDVSLCHGCPVLILLKLRGLKSGNSDRSEVRECSDACEAKVLQISGFELCNAGSLWNQYEILDRFLSKKQMVRELDACCLTLSIWAARMELFLMARKSNLKGELFFTALFLLLAY